MSTARPWIGKRVRMWREELVMTQTELARKAGVSVSTVARIEQRPDAPLRASTLRGLAKALKVRPDQLVAQPDE